MGRQLASFDGITYTYNEDGIRTSKTVNGERTYYYVDGTQLFEQTIGNDCGLHFFYDRNGELTAFALFDNIVMHNVIIEVISSAELFNDKTLSTLVKAKCGLGFN